MAQRQRAAGAIAAIGVGLAVGVALVLAGCGGSSGKPADPYGPTNLAVSLSRCMRANGLSSFPDPGSSPGGGVGWVGGLVVSPGGELTVEGVSFSGPALKRAEGACTEYLPPARGPAPQVSASQKAAALAVARCMRAHGVPNFPDPKFSGGGQIPLGGASGLDPNAPAFKHAMAVCGANRAIG